jgi:hypothetical protein
LDVPDVDEPAALEEEELDLGPDAEPPWEELVTARSSGLPLYSEQSSITYPGLQVV